MENEFHLLVSGPQRLKGVLEQTMAEFPVFTLLPIGEEALSAIDRNQLQEEKDREWLSEREELAQLVGGVLRGAINEDPVTLGNFKEFYEKRSSTISRWEEICKDTLSLEDFAIGAVRIFQRTNEHYKDIVRSPKYHSTSVKGNRVVMYRRPNRDLLNPREARLIIKKYGLNGQPCKPLNLLVSEEEVEKQAVFIAEEGLIMRIFRMKS